MNHPMNKTGNYLKSVKMRGAVLGMACLWSAGALAETAKLGKVEFIAETNVKMFRFTGEAHELQAKIQRKGNQLIQLEIRIPVASIKTGMEIRDKHTVERIFTAADGSTPDILYSADKSDCKPGASSTEQICLLDGKLTIRGSQKPFPLTVSFKDDNKVQGHAIINVLDFGVDPNTLMYTGIHVDKNVAVDFEVSLQ